MWRLIGLTVAALAVVILGFSLIEVSSGGEIGGSAVLIDPNIDTAGFARADRPYDWDFPRDFGAHPDFQTEWWYYTGNLATDDGRRFGYQFTIFRRAIQPTANDTESEWRTRQLYLAHFTVSDIANQRFYHDEIFSRGGAGLAGAETEPRVRVWLEDWQVMALDDEATRLQLTAQSDDMAVDLVLERVKPPALQGENGLSAKSDDAGNASYYYSLSRLLTEGTITIGGESFAVSGRTWMDHEFSTSALGGEAVGWDWFGLIFDDNTEMMVGQIRLADGGREPAFGGLFIHEDGSTQYLPSTAFDIEATDTWTSPHSGATYPSGWIIRVDLGEADPFEITLTPLQRDQELVTDISTYWEGAVEIGGDATGYGYAELTGYVDAMTGRF